MTKKQLEISKIIFLFHKGYSHEKIGKLMGVSRSTIGRRLKENGILPICKLDHKKIAKLYRDGKSLNEIAKSHNVSLTTIRNSLIKSKIEIREKGGIPELQFDKIICNEYKKGKSTREIAKEIKKSHTFVSKRLKANKITPKNRNNFNGLTSIETKIEKFLIKEKITFLSQYSYPKNRFVFDFFLPNNNIFIECDGDYFHGNPKLYKSLDKIQKRRKQNDTRKNAFINRLNLVKGKEYKILRFWEDDINNSFDNVKLNILLETKGSD